MLKRSRTPLRTSKYSNHIYNNYVHLVLLALRSLSGMSYERFLEWIENFDQLLVVLRIEKYPHFTTLQKFSTRIPRRYIDILIVFSTRTKDIRVLFTGIDSTGISLTAASYLYITVLERWREKGKRGRPRTRRRVRRFLKVTIIAELRTQMILAIKIRRGPDNDGKDFIPAYKKLRRHDKCRIKESIGDKGFDDEKNHRFSREDIGSYSIIPPRKNRSKEYRTTGMYRREMRTDFPLKRYRQRNKMETVNSVLKRKMGDSIRSRRCRCQNTEFLLRAFAYNIERGLCIYYIGWFLERPGPAITKYKKVVNIFKATKLPSNRSVWTNSFYPTDRAKASELTTRYEHV